MGKANSKIFIPLRIAVLTFSDSRTFENDTSGEYLEQSIISSGHIFVSRNIIKEDVSSMRKAILGITDAEVIITTGGTGFTLRDHTVAVVSSLLTKNINGFGELFRYLSYLEIGTATIQSNAFAGFINNIMIFCLPGSTNACKLGWEKILSLQLNSTTKPCNLATIVKKYL